nr:hypothetical protein Itr_chr12CG14180 [Ipomoea trifida]
MVEFASGVKGIAAKLRPRLLVASGRQLNERLMNAAGSDEPITRRRSPTKLREEQIRSGIQKSFTPPATPSAKNRSGTAIRTPRQPPPAALRHCPPHSATASATLDRPRPRPSANRDSERTASASALRPPRQRAATLGLGPPPFATACRHRSATAHRTPKPPRITFLPLD